MHTFRVYTVICNILHIDVQKTTTSLLYKELLNLRDSYLVFTGDFNFNHSNFLTLNSVPTV